MLRPLLILWALALAAACEREAAETPGTTLDCDVAAVPACVLEQAEAVLRGIEPGPDWVAAASELAVAHDEAGNPNQSLALLQKVVAQVGALASGKEKINALSDAVTAAAGLARAQRLAPLLKTLEQQAGDVPEADLRWDLLGKVFAAQALHTDFGQAEQKALAMPEGSFAQSAYKAVTIRKLAGLAAKKGDLAHAQELASLLTMSMDYYRSMANSDIALQALKLGDRAVLEETLTAAEAIARSQDDGYFVAGALREVAQVTFREGRVEVADRLFADARAGARDANSNQERARAMSRIATRMGDIGHTVHASATIEESVRLAEAEENEAMRHYSFYEIGGSAAMSGNFGLARDVIAKLPETPFGTARSLRAAAERDLAWGLARQGRAEEALEVANGIRTARERVAALARVARVLNEPTMQSLPRYL